MQQVLRKLLSIYLFRVGRWFIPKLRDIWAHLLKERRSYNYKGCNSFFMQQVLRKLVGDFEGKP